jgi:hypothetical protein
MAVPCAGDLKMIEFPGKCDDLPVARPLKIAVIDFLICDGAGLHMSVRVCSTVLLSIVSAGIVIVLRGNGDYFRFTGTLESGFLERVIDIFRKLPTAKRGLALMLRWAPERRVAISTFGV